MVVLIALAERSTEVHQGCRVQCTCANLEGCITIVRCRGEIWINVTLCQIPAVVTAKYAVTIDELLKVSVVTLTSEELRKLLDTNINFCHNPESIFLRYTIG